MRKKMTPCEKLGYKVGDKFELVEKSYKFYAGDVVYLQDDDGTGSPYFTNEIVKDEYPLGVSCFLSSIKKVAKLKPAKQALADAIHQNGGWRGGKYAVYGKHSGKCSFITCKPQYLPKYHGWFVMLSWIAGEFDMKPFVNWHQCILSREEYFTAYPEQVKVEVNNETKHQVEVEMKSESEMTIKVSDWHKNGELPPVGEFCIFSHPPCSEHYFPDFALKAKGKEVLIIAHTRFNRGVGDVAVMKWDFGDSGGVCSANQMCFIPLLTERDKAIDEMVDCLGSRLANCEEIAAHLYENGYRKEAK